MGTPSLSLVIPVYNEEQNVPLLHQEVREALDRLRLPYEVIYVDDGSRDGSVARLTEIAARDPNVVVICFRRNFGQTAALSAGITHSQGDIIILMDADLQNNPSDIPAMLAKLNEGYDVVSGWRRKRRDPFFSRKLPSRIANGIISKVTGVKLHDYGCTLKAYRRETLETTRLYGEMHRFIPVYASWAGARITEMPVNHRARKYGKSKYGIGRTIRVMFDLLTVKFLGSYSTKPLYAFGIIGVWLAVAAVVSEGLAVAARFTRLDLSLHNDPLTLAGIILFALAVQVVMMGLLAELIMRTYYESQGKPIYVVRNVLMGTAQGLVTLPYRSPSSVPLAMRRELGPEPLIGQPAPQHVLTLPSDLPAGGYASPAARAPQPGYATPPAQPRFPTYPPQPAPQPVAPSRFGGGANGASFGGPVGPSAAAYPAPLPLVPPLPAAPAAREASEAHAANNGSNGSEVYEESGLLTDPRTNAIANTMAGRLRDAFAGQRSGADGEREG